MNDENDNEMIEPIDYLMSLCLHWLSRIIQICDQPSLYECADLSSIEYRVSSVVSTNPSLES